MVWYYADGDRQRGPISDEEFQEMVNNGRIGRETLVWKDGMDNWQSLQKASDSGLVSISPSQPQTSPYNVPVQPANVPVAGAARADHCSQCGRGPLGIYDSVKLGNLLFCRDCDSDLARHYRSTTQVSPTAPHDESSTRMVGDLEYASIPSRFIAKIIDQIVSSVVMFIVLALTADVSLLQNALDVFRESGNIDQMYTLMRPTLLTGLVFTVLYDSLLIGFFGATLGKMAMRIHVVSPDGEPVGFSQAIIRGVAPAILQLPGIMLPSKSILGQLTSFVTIFAYLIAIIDPQKRTLFDHIAGTRVVRN